MVIAVCDDEALHLRRAVEQIRSLPSLAGATIRPYSSAEALLGDAARDIDIAVLDIQMGRSGIDVAREIQAAHPGCQIIFLTSYLGYATQVYDVEHVYFILKSELEQRIGGAVDRALEKLRLIKSQRIAIAFNGQATILELRDVKYLERVGHRTRVCARGGEHFTYERPEAVLKDHAGAFVRCHSSFYVNPEWVLSIAKNQIALREGGSVPISRLYAAAARRALMESAARVQM